MSAAALVGTLEALGVSLSLTPEGRLRMEPASLLPAELLTELRAGRDEIVRFLSVEAGEEGRNKTPETPETPGIASNTIENARGFSGVSPGFDVKPPIPVTLLEAIQNDPKTTPNPAQTPSKRYAPDPITAGQQAGRCGSCARWVAHAAPAAHLGVCDAGRRAHGWFDGAPLAPVETQAALLCQVYGGSGWRAVQKNATGARHNVAVLPAPREGMPENATAEPSVELERPA